MGELSTSRLETLAKTILKDRDPNARKEALLEIRRSNHPRVIELLQHISTKDKDRAVRDLAGNLLIKKKIQGHDELPKPETSKVAPLVSGSNGRTWACAFCWADNTGGEKCASCGAARAAKASANDPNGINTDAVFLLDPHNQNFLHGKTRRLGARTGPASTGCLLLFLLPFLVTGIAVIAWAVTSWYQWNALSNSGVPTTASIADKNISKGDDNDTYYISFSYTHNETTYTAKQEVDWDTYNTAEMGTTVNIEYVPSNPNIASLAGHNNPPYFQAGFSVVWNLIVWTIFIAILMGEWSNRLLAKEGKLVNGQVMTSKSSLEGDDNDFYLNLEYAFTSPETGKLTTGTAKGKREDLKGERLPAPGTPLAVLYRTNQHHKPL